MSMGIEINTYKNKKIDARTIGMLLLTLFSTVILFMNFFVLPNVNRTASSPYFHIENTPLVYWLGFSLSFILLTIFVIKNFSDKNPRNYKFIGYFSIFLLTIYIYVLPRLFYRNHIYTDTYLFVGEMLSILKNGKLGYGWSVESPALSLISSSISLISGLNYLYVVDVFLILIPVLYILFFYVLTGIFMSKKTFSLSYLALISINWFGFQFNRQSLGIVLQLFTFIYVLKVLLSDGKKFSLYVVMLLSYFSLVLSHPASPFILSMNVFAIFFVILILRSIKKGGITFQKISKNVEKNFLIETFLIGTVFIVIWLSWQIYTHGAIYVAYRNLIRVMFQLLNFVSPALHISGIISVYSNVYEPIVMFRLYEAFFVTILGNILSLILLFKMSKIEHVILSPWFFSSNWFLVFVLYSRSWIYRPIIYSLPSMAIMLSIILMSPINSKNYFSKLINVFKKSIFGLFMLLTITLPLIMYAHSPFSFPPTSYLKELEFITTHVKGPGVVFEAGSELRYHVMKNNSSLTYLTYPHFYDPNIGLQIDKLYDAKLITTSFRVYTKSEFIMTQPSLLKIVSETEYALMNLPEFGRFYDSDPWHKAYINILK